MFRTVCSKQWPEIAGRIWTYPVVALTLTLFAREVNWIFFPAVGAFLAADMAVQVGGDDVRWESFEFIFTRAVDRGKYFSAKFLFGLAPLAGLVVLYALFGAVDVKSLFWNLVMEPVGSEPHATAPGAGLFVIEALALLLDYSLVFFLCTASTRESSFPGYISLGFILAGIYAVLCSFFIASLFPDPPQSGLSGEEAFRALTLDPLFLVPLAALLAAPAAVLFALGRAYYSRCELPARVQAEGETFRGAGTWVAWLVLILFVLFIAAAVLFLGVTENSP